MLAELSVDFGCMKEIFDGVLLDLSAFGVTHENVRSFKTCGNKTSEVFFSSVMNHLCFDFSDGLARRTNSVMLGYVDSPGSFIIFRGCQIVDLRDFLNSLPLD